MISTLCTTHEQFINIKINYNYVVPRVSVVSNNKYALMYNVW